MPASAVTLDGGSSELIIAADDHRDFLTVQLHDANPVYLAFGEAAVDATGIALLYPGDSVKITDSKARLAVYGFAAGTPTIGTETSKDVTYRAGSPPAA